VFGGGFSSGWMLKTFANQIFRRLVAVEAWTAQQVTQIYLSSAGWSCKSSGYSANGILRLVKAATSKGKSANCSPRHFSLIHATIRRRYERTCPLLRAGISSFATGYIFTLSRATSSRLPPEWVRASIISRLPT